MCRGGLDIAPFSGSRRPTAMESQRVKFGLAAPRGGNSSHSQTQSASCSSARSRVGADGVGNHDDIAPAGEAVRKFVPEVSTATFWVHTHGSGNHLVTYVTSAACSASASRVSTDRESGPELTSNVTFSLRWISVPSSAMMPQKIDPRSSRCSRGLARRLLAIH